MTEAANGNLRARFHQGWMSIPDHLNSVFDFAEDEHFDLGFEWFRLLEKTTLLPGESVLVYSAECGGSTPGRVVLPLIRNRSGRQIKALANFYTSYYIPIGEGKGVPLALEDAFARLRSLTPRPVSIMLRPLPRESDLFAQVYNALVAAGWSTFPFFCFGNWHQPVAGMNYEDYWRGRPSTLRNTLIRKTKKFLGEGRGRIEILSGIDDTERAIDLYQRVYRASWKRPEPFPEFIPGLIRQQASKGKLRLGVAHIREEPAAAQLWIVDHRRAAIFKLAYDERFKPFSVGTILTDRMIRHAIEEDKVEEIDYLIGDDAYKRDWMSNRRERWGILAYNPASISGRLWALNEQVRRSFKQLKSFSNQSLMVRNYVLYENPACYTDLVPRGEEARCRDVTSFPKKPGS